MMPTPPSFWSFHAPMQLSGRCPLPRRCPSLVGDPAAEEWSPWSVCSLTCGQGLQVRTRSCVSSPYGTLCSGPLRETRPCNNSATCPGRRPPSCPICQQSQVLFVTGHNTAPPQPPMIGYLIPLQICLSSIYLTQALRQPGMNHSGYDRIRTYIWGPLWARHTPGASILVVKAVLCTSPRPFPPILLTSPAPLAASQLSAFAYSCPSPPPHWLKYSACP